MNRKQKLAQRARHPKAKPSKRQRERVLKLTAEGKNRELVATEAGVSIAKLRTDYASELDMGRKLAADKKANEAEAEALTIEEYYVLNNITNSFASDWYDEEFGNLIWEGTDGKGARTVEDAFAAWKAKGGKFNVTGLSTRFNKDKAAEFAKIVAEHRKTT